MLMIMKLCIVLTFGLILNLNASVFSQHKISMQLGEVGFKRVFNEITKQTGLTFMYSDSGLNEDMKVIANFKDADLKEILDIVFNGKNLTYLLKDEFVVIMPKEKAPVREQQQKIEINGKVVDENGNPLPGVTVQLEGISMGTATDNKGLFSLSLPLKKGVLIFSFIGYKTQKISFSTNKFLNVKMIEERSNLDEVNVVAYGEVSKREMTGAVSVVKADDIKNVPSSNINNLLQGRIAGMDVTNISGAPGGGGSQVTIRGYNSLSVESGRRFSNPLWVVDGVPMNSFTSPVTGTNALSDLNPETIESIQVLKDASATSLYGSRAANGVILVTTKKGRKNMDAQFSVNISQTYSILPEYPTIYGGKGERDYKLKGFMNGKGAFWDENIGTYRYPSSYKDAWDNRDEWGVNYDHFWGNGKVSNLNNGNELQDSLNAFYNNSTNFFKYYFDPGKVTNANIQAYGGSERIDYSVGLGFYDETGILKGTGFKRINLMGNFNMIPVKRLSLDFRTNLSFTDRSRGVKNSGLAGGNEIETIPGDPLKLSSLLPGNNNVVRKTLDGLKGKEEKNTSYRLRSSFGLNYDICKGANFSTTFSIDYSQNNRNLFSPSTLNERKESMTTGEIARNMMVLNESLFNYKISVNNHNIDLMLGFSYQYDEENYIGGTAENGPSDLVHYATDKGWPSLGEWEDGRPRAFKYYKSDFTDKKLISYFGRINYNYKKRYMLTATLRRDGSSVFGENVRWATFPSGAFAWNISEEDFMRWADFIDFAKLRTSYGISGNQFTNPYLSYGILLGDYPYEGNPTISPKWQDGFYNPNLTWEETAQTDIGIDMNMFNYRLSFTFDYYYRYTDKLLYICPLPGDYSGYSSQWKNAAALSNEGVEFELKYDIFRKNDLRWNISMNIAKNWNQFRKSYNSRDLGGTGVDGVQHYYILGKELGGIYGFQTKGYLQTDSDVEYYYNQNGSLVPVSVPYSPESHFVPGDIKIIDTNGDKVIDFNDYIYLGSSLPKLYGGIVNEIKYKNFDLNVLLSYSLGRDMIYTMPIKSLSVSKVLSPVFVDIDNTSFWEKEGDESDFAILSEDRYNRNLTPVADRYVEKVNYIKLKTLTLGYTLPGIITKKTGLKEARIFFSGENLFTLTNYSGLDPETVDINTGLDDGNQYPLARKFTLGLTIKL